MVFFGSPYFADLHWCVEVSIGFFIEYSAQLVSSAVGEQMYSRVSYNLKKCSLCTTRLLGFGTCNSSCQSGTSEEREEGRTSGWRLSIPTISTKILLHKKLSQVIYVRTDFSQYFMPVSSKKLSTMTLTVGFT
jgi:hypothetical protein